MYPFFLHSLSREIVDHESVKGRRTWSGGRAGGGSHAVGTLLDFLLLERPIHRATMHVAFLRQGHVCAGDNSLCIRPVACAWRSKCLAVLSVFARSERATSGQPGVMSINRWQFLLAQQNKDIGKYRIYSNVPSSS